jgi:uncharacterized membrane protein
MALMETRTRTIVKTISWRVIGVFITALIAWNLTGNSKLSVTVGLLDCFIKIAIFYLHERLWARVKFGYKAPDFTLPASPQPAAAPAERTPVGAGRE